MLGDPANIVLSDDQRTAFVMNHHGAVANPEFLQHGGRASIAGMDVRKLLDRRLDDTNSALEHDFDAGWFGGVGLLVTPRLIVAGYSGGGAQRGRLQPHRPRCVSCHGPAEHAEVEEGEYHQPSSGKDWMLLTKPGDLLADRFEVEHQIRSGGMSEIFRARDRTSNETVAVKIISDLRGHRAARFGREVALLSELSHPAIVRYLSHGATSSGELFLVMEWLDGEDLSRRLECEPLTMGESVTLATRVAEALGAAHARGVVHRDLKPSNLFLCDGRLDQVKVLDFGISHKEGLTPLTRTGSMIGTPGYMAPEQVRGITTVDARADIFALGCVLFQCLTGTAPFEGDSPEGRLGKILFGEVPRVNTLWPEVPDDLDALIARMLSKDPALRPSDGTNLAAALGALGPRVHSAAVAPRRQAVQHAALTSNERRFLSVVLLGAADSDPLAEDELQRAIRPFGGRMEQLANGLTIVMVDAERTVVTDQATQAAHCALAIRALARQRPMAIAMGRAESTSKLPETEVIDRALRLLVIQPPALTGLPPIALDEISAGLLDARFDVTEMSSGLMLRGERTVMPGARTLLGRPTSCVGRDWELNALTTILGECIDEPAARTVVVTAAAGMGKSRLAAEFVAHVQRRDKPVAVWVGRGDSLRAGATLDLLAQALRGALGIHGGEPLAERHDQIRARVAERVPAAERTRLAEFLGELIGAPFPDDATSASLHAARQDAQLMGEQMRKAWLDFLDAEAAAQPVLLVLEDLHWGDFGTVRFLDIALRDRRERPWMVLALARPDVFEVFPKLWAERQNVQELRLKELGRRAGERLVRQVLGDTVGSDTVERLVKQSDGNAFYLEELIRAVAQGKDQALPETVLAMVETRLARLPLDARRVLRAASVFGEVCWNGGVVALLGDTMPAAAVAEWLTMLVEQELLVVRPDGQFPGEHEFAFRHALLREGAYATLTVDDERLMHRLAGKWLERHGEGDPMVLAGHFERGGDGASAARHYLRATQQAMHIHDPQVAMARAALGLACAPPPELRIPLLGFRCAGADFAQQVSLDETEELLRLAIPGSVPWGQAIGAYMAGLLRAGRIEELLASIARLHDVTPTPDGVGSTSLALFVGVIFLDLLGQVRQGTALEQSLLSIVRACGDQEPIAQWWWHTSVANRAANAHDDPWAAVQHTAALHDLFDVIGGELFFVSVKYRRGMNQWHLGALESAAQALEAVPVMDTALSTGSSMRRFMLSWLYADLGELAQARDLATQLAESGRAHHNRLEEGRGRWVLAEVLRRDGDLDGADREVGVALAMAVPLDCPGVLATLSALRLAQGRAGDALAAAEDAMARSKAMGGCGLFRGSFMRLAHAEALHATGAHDAAARAIADARARLLAIADKIADPGYKTSFLERVPENARTLALAHVWLSP